MANVEKERKKERKKETNNNNKKKLEMVVLDMSWLVFMYGVQKKKKGFVQNHEGRAAVWLVLVSGWLLW